MVALGFTNLVFCSYIGYILIEKKERFYKSQIFWLLIIGLLISLYITNLYYPLGFEGDAAP